MTENELLTPIEFIIDDVAPLNFQIVDDQDNLDLGVGNPVIISEVYPDYEGEYEITPTAEKQTLETKFRTLLEKIIIAPIPQNYGLITYNGACLTVS